jgi:hypothetical protein
MTALLHSPLGHGTWRRRLRYADGLERAIDRAAAVATPFSTVVPVSPEADGPARPVLLDLAERLRRPGAVRAEGLELVRRLLTDGAGPLYYGPPGALCEAALAALRALDLPAFDGA